MARKKKYESFAEEVIQGTYKNVNTFSTNDYIDENIVKPTLKATKSKTGLKNIDTTKYGKLKIKTDYNSDFTDSVLEGKYDSKNAYYSQDSTDSQVKENKKNKEKEIKGSFEKAKKGQKSEQKLANDNLKTKQKEFDNAINKYQKELSNAYKEEEISFDNRAGLSRENDKISYQTKDKDKTKGTLNTDEQAPAIAKVFEKVKKSREKADEKLNELNFAKYQKNVADVNAEETNWYDKTIGNIVRGAADLGSILDIESQKYKTPEGKEVFLPTKNELKQQKVSEDYNTGIGKFLGDVTYNVSKIGTSLALNTVTGGIGGTATYWTDMYADNYKNAINEGYDKKKAIAYSTIGTAAEYATGKLIGSATKGLTGGKTSQLSSAISNTTNKFLKNPTISNFIGNAGSEGAEEFVQEYVDNLNRLVTLEGSKNVDDYIDVFTDKDIFQDALYSAGVGALSGVASNITDGTGKTIKDNTAVIRDFRNQLEQSKSETKDTAKIEKYDKAISLVDDYLKNPFVNNGQINTELANTYNQYQQQQLAPSDLETGVQQFVQERATQEVNNRAIQNQVNAFNLGQNTPINTNTLGNTETSLQGQKTAQIKPNFVESAQKYNIKTDNDTIKSINRVMSERGVNANFDDTLFKNSNVNALWRTNEDGTREVVFNPNANTNDLLENVAVHELYHDIIQQKGNNFLQDIVLDMASTKDDYINARNELLNEYSKVYDTNNPNFNNMVNEEAVASILGQKLGNQEFINELTTKKRSIAKVIYDNVVSLLNKLNKLTGYKSEKLYWADVKNKFENAYRSTSISSKKSDTKYSLSESKKEQELARLKEEFEKTSLFDPKKAELRTKINMLEDNFEGTVEEYNQYKNNQKKQRELEREKRQQERENKKQQQIEKNKRLEKEIKEATPLKRKQYEIVQKYNPMLDETHVGIRSPKDIKSFDEAMKDEESFSWGDFSLEDAEKALKEGKITIYSSYPIEQGIFVSTSKIQAQEYAGGKGAKVYEKVVPLNEVAWINGDEGQYAKVTDTKYSIGKEEVDKALKEFRDYKDKNGFNDKAKELQKRYNKLQSEYKRQNQTLDSSKKTKSDFEKSTDEITSRILNKSDNDKITEQTIDEEIYNNNSYKKEYIEIESDVLEKLGITEEEADKRNRELYDKYYDKITENLSKEGISRRYDRKSDNYVYDTQELAQKGYNELLDYLDKNNIDYEVSKSTEAGYVPSIYIKDNNGETIYRIGNHDNGRISDFDKVYNESYNNFFSDKDYANWKENIIPKINKETGLFNKIR